MIDLTPEQLFDRKVGKAMLRADGSVIALNWTAIKSMGLEVEECFSTASSSAVSAWLDGDHAHLVAVRDKLAGGTEMVTLRDTRKEDELIRHFEEYQAGFGGDFNELVRRTKHVAGYEIVMDCIARGATRHEAEKVLAQVSASLPSTSESGELEGLVQAYVSDYFAD